MKNKLGWLFIIISCLCYLLILIIPFLPFSIGLKTASITASIVLAEIFFWVGAIFVGKEVIRKFRSYLKPQNWRSNRVDK
ncbi:transporter suffix domain-containing protein [Rummeliibacillus sp. JY-2-4R]